MKLRLAFSGVTVKKIHLPTLDKPNQLFARQNI